MIKERLVKFLSYKDIGQSVFEKKVGIANGYVNGIKKSIGSDILNKIAKVYPELNIEWLISGAGEMLKVEDIRTEQIKNEVEAVPEDMYMMAEYADLRSFAGRLGGNDMEQLPETHKRLLPREYEKGNYLVVRVSGDSMNDGTSRSLFDGDEVLVRELAPSEWENIPIRNSLFVITSRDGNVLKQIKEINRSEQYIVCHSFSPSYEDFKVPFEDIYQIFVVCKIVKKQITF